MRLSIAEDARDQVRILLGATALAIVLSFVPYANIVMYPFRLFVTFIHEGGHALAAIATGNAVTSLTVQPDGSGEVMATHGGLADGLLISSAGYLGATAYGALLLFLLRRKVAERIILVATAAFVGLMSLRFGYASIFTLFWGLAIAGALLVAAKYADAKLSNFVLSFVAVQCVLNALFDLRMLLNLSSPLGVPVHTDAANMAAATGIPAIVWAVAWIGISLVVLRLALLSYAAKAAPASTTPLGI
jgi:hypothetical protein